MYFGLSSSNDHNTINYQDIDYAIHFGGRQKISICEYGINVSNQVTNFTENDVFTVKRTGTKITYHKNGGDALYTSTATSTGDLALETALDEDGSSLTDIKISREGFNITFNDNATQDAVNAITNAVTVTNTDANNPQVITVNATDVSGNKSGRVIQGTTGNDTIQGSDNNDIIKGGAGNDVIKVGLGDDQLTGGAGNDIFDLRDAI
ncbi:MAG: hypothetical protein FE834_06985, partial [Gammaproteobacteria bacterium]|nr:hypothetical protein [Gammaproteobacteria bacterium]